LGSLSGEEMLVPTGFILLHGWENVMRVMKNPFAFQRTKIRRIHSRQCNGLGLAVAVTVLSAPRLSAAGTSQWIGGTSDWNNANNWSPVGVPAFNDDVNLTNTLGLSQTITYDYTGSISLGVLFLEATGGNGSENLSMSANSLTDDGEGIGGFAGAPSNGVGAVNQSGGTNTITGGGSLLLGYNGSGDGASEPDQGSYTLGGTGVLSVSGEEVVGNYGIGTLNQYGGSNSATDVFVAAGPGSTGTYMLSGTGVLTVSGVESCGVPGGSDDYLEGSIYQSGGTNTIAGGINGNLNVGILGMYALSGTGLLSVSGTEQIGTGNLYTVTPGVFNQSGGSNIASAVNIGNVEYISGEYILSGGSLAVNGNVNIASAGAVPGLGAAATGVLTVSGSGTVTIGGELETSSRYATVNLAGGTINTSAINFSGASPPPLIWTSGTLDLTSTVTFDPLGSSTTGAAFGSSLSVGANQTFIITGNEGLGGTGAFTLTLNSGGTHTVTGTLTVNSKGTLTQNGGSLSAATLSGNFTQIGGTAAFGQITSGKIAISGGQTTLASNAGVSELGGLTVSGSGTLDVTNNTLFISYASQSPASAIQSYLASGYNGGNWNGPGIISSTVANLNAGQSAVAYSVGYADGSDGITGVPSGEIEIMPTLAGDAKMQGNVVFGDFQLLSQYFGQTGTTWDEGDFTYNGTTNFGDFQLLSQNFGANASALTAGEIASLNSFATQFGDTLAANPDRIGFQLISVPEPASAGLLALTGLSLLSRRRRAKD
jgi:hypothetical protein